MKYTEVIGDLILLVKNSSFDVISHGCNCFCQMGAGIAPHMAKEFGCDKFPLEDKKYKGDINKLGQIDYGIGWLRGDKGIYGSVIVVNAYTQYRYGKNHPDGVKKPVDYDAITLCMRKINHQFNGKRIGLPKIGCGLAGGDWNIVSNIIKKELKDCDVTIVILPEKK
jgi:O-acetyl-ADP-ribose deacetylase (regulator of RNase III)